MGLSRVQFYRKIKALTNYSPGELLRNIRLRRADTMLKTGEATISEIAYAVGFSSPSYFTKSYHDFFGESPTDVRRRFT
jgi:transcriptional regulator GlxA family with amidase domain